MVLLIFTLIKLKISYNRRDTVLNTWNNPNNNIKPNLKLDGDELLKQLEDFESI